MRGWAGLGTGVLRDASAGANTGGSFARAGADGSAGGPPLRLDVGQVVRASCKMGALLDVLALCRAERRTARRRELGRSKTREEGGGPWSGSGSGSGLGGDRESDGSASGHGSGHELGEPEPQAESGGASSSSSTTSSDGSSEDGSAWGARGPEALSVSSRAVLAWQAALGIPSAADAEQDTSMTGSRSSS